MRRTLLAVSIALTAVALVVIGGKAFGSLGNPTIGIALDVAQIQPNTVPGTSSDDLFVVKVLCGSLSILGAGTYRTEINVYNAADLGINPVNFQIVSTGAFSSNGGAETAIVSKTIDARSAIRVECSDVTSRLGTPNVMGFVRIQPPSTAEIAVTAVWTRTF